MNPLKWKQEHQAALILAIVLGVSLGEVTGYFASAMSAGASGFYRFGRWLGSEYETAATVGWGLFGGFVGAGFIYLKRLNSN
jgi:hypothetical protein